MKIHFGLSVVICIAIGHISCNSADEKAAKDVKSEGYISIIGWKIMDTAVSHASEPMVELKCESDLPAGSVIVARIQKDTDRSGETIPSACDTISLAKKEFTVNFPVSLMVANCIFYAPVGLQKADIASVIKNGYDVKGISEQICPDCIYYSSFRIDYKTQASAGMGATQQLEITNTTPSWKNSE